MRGIRSSVDKLANSTAEDVVYVIEMQVLDELGNGRLGVFRSGSRRPSSISHDNCSICIRDMTMFSRGFVLTICVGERSSSNEAKNGNGSRKKRELHLEEKEEKRKE